MVIVLKRTSFVKVCLFLFRGTCVRACLLIDKCITQLDILRLEVLLSLSLSLPFARFDSADRNSIELGLVVACLSSRQRRGEEGIFKYFIFLFLRSSSSPPPLPVKK